MFFNENENNDLNIIIPSDITNHTAIAISAQVIRMRYFSAKSCSTYFTEDKMKKKV